MIKIEDEKLAKKLVEESRALGTTPCELANNVLENEFTPSFKLEPVEELKQPNHKKDEAKKIEAEIVDKLSS